jgi:3',5'-cyclic AMP phosphodiesterase CpdA
MSNRKPFQIWIPFVGMIIIAFVTSTFLFGCHHDSTTPPNPTDTTKTPVDTTHHTATSSDTVLYSFATLGCNRLDASNIAGSPSTANVAQLDRSLADVMNLSPRPDLLILTGDIILGKTTDTSVTGAQLRAWIAHYQSLPIASSGIKLIVVPGNHEFNDGSGSAALEQQWLQIMSPYINGSNGPKPGGADALTTDQSKLTYSFDYMGSHFVMLNSDPAGEGSTVSVNWVAQDLAQAHAAGTKHIFLFDHKPAYDWTNDGSTSLVDNANRDALWSAMENNHAEALFAAHNHVYRRMQPKAKSYMIVAGNGGSSLTNDIGADRNFGFALVQVMTNGKVIEKAYARDYGTNYYDPSPAAMYPTTLRDSVDITWKY